MPAKSTDARSLRQVRAQHDLRIPLRDGVDLSATLYVPEDHRSPSPALFSLTPYTRQTQHDRGMHFVAHGYPFLTVDVRGRGDSEGEFKPLTNEARDGYDVVEWLAAQPYCNGKVAMLGGSYSGYCQWATAAQCPPHLATIVPVSSPFLGVDFPFRRNIAGSYLMRWLTLVLGRASQERIFMDQPFWNAAYRRWFESGAPFKDLDTEVGTSSPVFQEWIGHPHPDEYWDRYNPSPSEYARLSIPVLTITGSYDGDQAGALTHYREHLRHNPAGAENHHLVIGPWDHAGTRNPKTKFCGIEVGPDSLVDLSRLHREWYAWTMEGGTKPEFLKNKKVAYYVMGADKWRYSDSVEEITTGFETLYLDSRVNPTDVFTSGTLSGAPPSGDTPDHYVYDPRDVSHAELEQLVDFESLVDQRMIHARAGRQLVYHSAPFDRNVEVSGFFGLSLWLAIDQPDTDFGAWVYEIDLDGRSVMLTSDQLRARYRESAREPRLLRTREPCRYDFEHFPFVSREIKQGHRLRLVFGPVNSIFWQKNYNGGGVVAEESIADARTVNVRLFHNAHRQSSLRVPLGRGNCDEEN